MLTITERAVTPLGLKPGSTGYQTCTLTATPKSQALWYGSQSTYSCEVTALRHTALPFGKHTHALHTHTGVLLPSQSAPHTLVLRPISGVPHTGVNPPGGHSHSFTGMPPMTSQQAIPLLTPFVAKGERSHPTWTRTRVYRVPNKQRARLEGMAVRAHTHL